MKTFKKIINYIHVYMIGIGFQAVMISTMLEYVDKGYQNKPIATIFICICIILASGLSLALYWKNRNKFLFFNDYPLNERK